MYFASDNTAPAHPKVIEAMAAVNTGYLPSYGEDEVTEAARDRIRELFEAPDAAVHFVTTGSAANVLALSLYTQPYQTVFCSGVAHIHTDECGAPEFYTGGAKLTLLDHEHGKITPKTLQDAIQSIVPNDPHLVQPGSVSITNITECGTLYSPAEVAAISKVCKVHNLPFHMDGARFANALVASQASPAEMTWRAGVDVLSFGGTKNGLIGVEAVVIFDPVKAWEFELRRKRGGHLLSKNRYLAAQMQAYLTDGLWLDMAQTANEAADRLEKVLASHAAATIAHPRQSNAVFVNLPRGHHRRLLDRGAVYSVAGPLDGPDDEILTARLMCSWCTTAEEVDAFSALLAEL